MDQSRRQDPLPTPLDASRNADELMKSEKRPTNFAAITAFLPGYVSPSLLSGLARQKQPCSFRPFFSLFSPLNLASRPSGDAGHPAAARQEPRVPESERQDRQRKQAGRWSAGGRAWTNEFSNHSYAAVPPGGTLRVPAPALADSLTCLSVCLVVAWSAVHASGRPRVVSAARAHYPTSDKPTKPSPSDAIVHWLLEREDPAPTPRPTPPCAAAGFGVGGGWPPGRDCVVTAQHRDANPLSCGTRGKRKVRKSKGTGTI
jgi:hypothetical protein